MGRNHLEKNRTGDSTGRLSAQCTDPMNVSPSPAKLSQKTKTRGPTGRGRDTRPVATNSQISATTLGRCSSTTPSFNRHPIPWIVSSALCNYTDEMQKRRESRWGRTGNTGPQLSQTRSERGRARGTIRSTFPALLLFSSFGRSPKYLQIDQLLC